jgi:hypothetical protein
MFAETFDNSLGVPTVRSSQSRADAPIGAWPGITITSAPTASLPEESRTMPPEIKPERRAACVDRVRQMETEHAHRGAVLVPILESEVLGKAGFSRRAFDAALKHIGWSLHLPANVYAPITWRA